MKIIISPAKKMKVQCDVIENMTTPIFLDRAQYLSSEIAKLNLHDLQNLFKANDQITRQNFERYQNMNFKIKETPAILAYDGIQYKYMAPAVFEDGNFEYAQKHLRIISALYGVLKPLDFVTEYRLEMQAKLQIENCKNMYEYWGDDIYNAEFANEDIIINLASNEYSKVIKKCLKKNQSFINVIFGEMQCEKVIEKGVYVKMARGEMVRYMAENNVKSPHEIKSFNRLGYKFSHDLSNDNKYVFIKEKKND